MIMQNLLLILLILLKKTEIMPLTLRLADKITTPYNAAGKFCFKRTSRLNFGKALEIALYNNLNFSQNIYL